MFDADVPVVAPEPKTKAPPSQVAAIAFTATSLFITVAWQAAPGAIPFLPWSMWIWFICCGIVLLSASRFFIHHSIRLPELYLLAFPFLFEIFFQKVCPTARVPSVDELLWAFDAPFGYPQVSLGKFLSSSSLLIWIFKLIWWSLPLQFVIVYLLVPQSVRRKYLLAIAATGLLILPLYALCPGAGPIYLFREQYPYPNSLPIPLANPRVRLLSRGLLLNTTPSGHVAWALLLFWFTWKYCRRLIAAVFGLLALAMVLATLGLGEHYVIDLILSVPYAAAIWSLVERQWRRFAALLLLVVLWLLALREGWALHLTPALAYLFCALTICLPLLRRGSSTYRLQEAP